MGFTYLYRGLTRASKSNIVKFPRFFILSKLNINRLGELAKTKNKFMIKIRQVLLATSIVLAAILNGCSPKTYIAAYAKKPVIKLAENVPSAQTQGGITVEMKPLDVNAEYTKSFYTQPIRVTYVPFLSKDPITESQNSTFQLFDNLTPFSVTISNNTDHILRMKDSRVVFIDPKSDEPLMAVDKQSSEIYSDIQKINPTFNYTKYLLAKKYPMTTTLDNDINMALVNIIKEVKFINGFNMEIMPGMKISGILLFIKKPEQLAEGKISFIDMISKTDAAGNPTEKFRFDYKTNLFYTYYKVDRNKNIFVVTSEEDYNKGLTNPDKYFYDKTQKKWILGDPPKK